MSFIKGNTVQDSIISCTYEPMTLHCNLHKGCSKSSWPDYDGAEIQGPFRKIFDSMYENTSCRVQQRKSLITEHLSRRKKSIQGVFKKVHGPDYDGAEIQGSFNV